MRPADCHPERKHLSGGLCQPCYQRAYRAAHIERMRKQGDARGRRWRAANLEKWRAAYRKASQKWRVSNPGKNSERARNHRALKRGATGRHTDADIQTLFASYHGLCVYCLSVATEVDHIIPLMSGGSNSPENLVPSCRQCNASKMDWPFVVWMAKYQRKAA